MYFILFIQISIFVLYPLIILLHELGHAIPALVVTRQKVTIYIGSYGDPQTSLCFRVGLLEFYIRSLNLFNWKSGLCVPGAEDISLNKRILYVVGPLASFLVAALACYGIFVRNAHGPVKLFFVVFVGLAIRDLLVNLIPRSQPIVLHDGTSTYNDGYLLRQLFFYKRQLPALEKGQQLLAEGQYAPAARLFETMLKEEWGSAYAYRIVRDTYLNAHHYSQALKLQEKLQEKYPRLCAGLPVCRVDEVALGEASGGNA